MNYTWDIKILFPILILATIGILIIYWKKIRILHKHGLFFLQQFLFWSSIYLFVAFTNDYGNWIQGTHAKNPNVLNVWLTIFTSITFFTLFLFMPANIISSFFRNRKVWIYSGYTISITSIMIFLAWPSFATEIIFAIGMGFSVASTATYYLFYNENFNNRSYPFKTISLIFSVILLANLFGYNLESLLFIIAHYKKEEGILHNPIIFNCFMIIGFLLLLVSMFIIFYIPENPSLFGYSEIQFKKLDPFFWSKGMIIFIFTGILILINEISHYTLGNWMIAQNAWTIYKDENLSKMFVRISNEFWLIPQILVAILCERYIFRNIGIKYAFSIGLLILFLYFAGMAFTTSPIVLLFLSILGSIGNIIVILILIGLTIMWNARTPKKRILSIMSIVVASSKFLSIFIIHLLTFYNVSIFGHKDINDIFVKDDSITHLLNEKMPIIFSIFAIIIIILFLAFYFISNYILGEYYINSNVDSIYKVYGNAKVEKSDQKPNSSKTNVPSKDDLSSSLNNKNSKIKATDIKRE